jgi:hypothetical protein
MTNDPKLALDKALSAIDSMAIDLPKVRRRSELQMIAQNILLLTEIARRKAQEMEREILILKHEYPAKRFERKKGVKRG